MALAIARLAAAMQGVSRTPVRAARLGRLAAGWKNDPALCRTGTRRHAAVRALRWARRLARGPGDPRMPGGAGAAAGPLPRGARVAQGSGAAPVRRPIAARQPAGHFQDHARNDPRATALRVCRSGAGGTMAEATRTNSGPAHR